MFLVLSLALAADPPPSGSSSTVPSSASPTLFDQLLAALEKVDPALEAVFDDLQGGQRKVEAGAPSRAPNEAHGPCTADAATRFWTGAVRVVGPLPPPTKLASTLWLVEGQSFEKFQAPLPARSHQFRLDVEHDGTCRTAQVLQETCMESPDPTGACTRCPSTLTGDVAQLCRAVDYVDSLRYFDLRAMLDDKNLHREVRAYVQAALKGGELE